LHQGRRGRCNRSLIAVDEAVPAAEIENEVYFDDLRVVLQASTISYSKFAHTALYNLLFQLSLGELSNAGLRMKKMFAVSTT